MDLEKNGNLIEAALWSIFAVVFVVKGVKARGRLRKVFLLLAPAFLAFGLSDVVESYTGAWWKPPWLLVWKVACIAVFFWGFREYRKAAGCL